MRRLITACGGILVLALVLGLSAEQGWAQDTQSSQAEQSLVRSSALHQAEFKDPGTATFVSIACAGCGQIWAGDIGRGLVMLGSVIMMPVVGSVISVSTCDLDGCSSMPMVMGILGAVGVWGYSIYDAAPTARRVNALHGFSVAPGRERGEFVFQLSIPVGPTGR